MPINCGHQAIAVLSFPGSEHLQPLQNGRGGAYPTDSLWKIGNGKMESSECLHRRSQRLLRWIFCVICLPGQPARYFPEVSGMMDKSRFTLGVCPDWHRHLLKAVPFGMLQYPVDECKPGRCGMRDRPAAKTKHPTRCTDLPKTGSTETTSAPERFNFASLAVSWKFSKHRVYVIRVGHPTDIARGVKD